jgi:hypothetical protein
VREEMNPSVTLHKGTCENILRNLNYAIDFFDNEDAICLDWTDILVPAKLSVINVAGKGGSQFGSILLRDLLHKIIQAKNNQQSKVKILIIIDEVHQFYDTEATREGTWGFGYYLQNRQKQRNRCYILFPKSI